MSTASRRTKWHPTPPPPPPSPKILHFPRSRRTRRKQTKPTANHHHHNNPSLLMHQKYQSYKGKLENLFDKENNESNPKTSGVERRERVEEQDCGDYNGGGGFEEEKWRFQAEILRAECKLLRMEREFALKKLEKNRVKMERTLRSAVQTLVSGRKKIFEGKNVNAVLEEEIEDLEDKLEELQKSSRNKDYEVLNCSNFDKKACLLQRRLENLGGLSNESCVKDLQELNESSSSINMNRNIDKYISISDCKTDNISTDVDMLRKKMEGLSKGILDRVEEEYNSILSSTANSSVASSASTSKRIECPEIPNFSTRQLYQANPRTLLLSSNILIAANIGLKDQTKKLHEQTLHENKCSGRCKAIIRRIVEQVRTETEQWSQMQEMLVQVRGEMEELQASRDFWENRAYNSDYEIQSLRHAVEEWKEKALGYENKVNELQLQVFVLKEEIQKSESDLPPVPLGKQLEKEKLVLSFRLKKNCHIDEEGSKFENALEEQEQKERTPNKTLPPLSLGKQLAKEKRMLFGHFKENRDAGERGSRRELSADGGRKPYSTGIGILGPKRSPLMDIGNSSPLARQNSRSAFAILSPESSRIRDSFRK
ncbi:hypothetical protein DH2020_000991 [Rehmannia glutinosa]|uniref:Uncharacterized protein n=1 Tax=Rehmannia glutinosa TaxID=99300 RepID=A0ABR0XY31_REHGL